MPRATVPAGLSEEDFDDFALDVRVMVTPRPHRQGGDCSTDDGCGTTCQNGASACDSSIEALPEPSRGRSGRADSGNSQTGGGPQRHWTPCGVRVSWLEQNRLILLDFDPDVVGVASQPFRLHWHDGKEKRRHVPGYFVRLANGRARLVDFRAEDQVEDRIAEAFAATERACSAVGWEFRHVGGPNSALMANLRWLARYGHPRWVGRRWDRSPVTGDLRSVDAVADGSRGRRGSDGGAARVVSSNVAAGTGGRSRERAAGARRGNGAPVPSAQLSRKGCTSHSNPLRRGSRCL
ncbi:TnsA-like heteromeric transposase endonuclease subunit [Streptomyces sp. NPDC088789]|uniref:TnsA-like heteromeric transposase endonuclease subunit n=1 Tax=Streptomyces sp. NPDC088789 TaxID=3365899 RepID=UPI00381B232A